MTWRAIELRAVADRAKANGEAVLSIVEQHGDANGIGSVLIRIATMERNLAEALVEDLESLVLATIEGGIG